jgi:hypothetical protein
MYSIHFLGVFEFFWATLAHPLFSSPLQNDELRFDVSVGYCPTQVTLSGSIPSCSPIQPYDKETLTYWIKSEPKIIQSTPPPFLLKVKKKFLQLSLKNIPFLRLFSKI